MGKESQLETTNCEVNDQNCPSIKNEEEVVDEVRYSTDGDSGLPICRVCQCAESDRRGDTALGILGITPPLPEAHKTNANVTIDVTKAADIEQKNPVLKMESGFIETVNHDGEAFIYTNDIELGIWKDLDSLLELGCSCKNELALVHYACALKWFLNHGSTVCEICGHVAENINQSDLNKVIVALRDYATQRGRLADKDPNPLDQDTVLTIRKQRLSEISSWFGPYNMNNNNGGSSVDSQAMFEQPLGVVNFGILPTESRATKWAVEGTGILLATGLLTVTLVWLIAPRVGKKTATSGLHILLGGLCALTVVIFFRFVVLTRIRYGPARYWAILFIFWFLVFGIWASRSNASHTNH